MIPMPHRHSVADKIARAASKCLRFACERHFQHIRLADVAQIASGGTPSTSEPALWNGDFIWVTPKDLGLPRNIEISDSERRISQKGLETSTTLLPIGTVLLSSRAPIGHLGIASVPLCTNQGFKNIICSQALDNRYLFHILRASIEELDALGHGNTFREIPAKVVRDFEIALPSIDTQRVIARFLDCLYKRLGGAGEELPDLPAPLSDQRRIVMRIEELASKIEEARGLRRQAVEEAEVLMRMASSDWFDQAKANDCPIGETFEFRNDLIRPGDGSSGALRFIGLQHIESHTGKRIGEDSMTAEGLNGRKFRFSPGEIVYGYLRPYLNKVWIADCEGVCSVDQYVIRPKPGKVETKYLAYFMQSEVFLRQAIELTHNLLLPRLRTALLEGIPIPLPTLVEQRRIVTHLDDLQAKVDGVKRLQAETSAELEALLPSVLDRAFKGEL